MILDTRDKLDDCLISLKEVLSKEQKPAFKDLATLKLAIEKARKAGHDKEKKAAKIISEAEKLRTMVLKASTMHIEEKVSAELQASEDLQASKLVLKLDDLEALLADARDAGMKKNLQVMKLEQWFKAAQSDAAQSESAQSELAQKPPKEGDDPAKESLEA